MLGGYESSAFRQWTFNRPKNIVSLSKYTYWDLDQKHTFRIHLWECGVWAYFLLCHLRMDLSLGSACVYLLWHWIGQLLTWGVSAEKGNHNFSHFSVKSRYVKISKYVYEPNALCTILTCVIAQFNIENEIFITSEKFSGCWFWSSAKYEILFRRMSS